MGKQYRVLHSGKRMLQDMEAQESLQGLATIEEMRMVGEKREREREKK
jgi:hypothetical protein